jgi:hypothetical protein
MTSRYYMGEPVPAYRVLTDVPPVVPMLLAAIRSVVPDPVAALHVLAMLLLVGLGVSFYLLGALVVGSRWAGSLAIVVGLLVTDRFTELFAFGGLLQVAALTMLAIAIAAYTWPGRTSTAGRGWWLLGAISLGLCALTHVGTGIIGVPVGLTAAALAAVSAYRRSDGGLRRFAVHMAIPMIGLGLVGLYWLLVLVPASGEYLTNPASLAYRGPDRLFELLLGRWPTAAVLVLGAATLALGTLRALVLRRFDGYLVLGAWAVLTWGALAYAILTGSATDYPRFGPPLLAPLVIGAAAGLLWGLRRFAHYLGELGLRGSTEFVVVGVAVVGAVLVATPLAIDRHTRQATTYRLRDAVALVDAATWIDTELPEGQAVLADVREGKWVEGLTGREALFSQAVRYAFRPVEWQRSVEADAVLRSVETLTSGYMTAQFTGMVQTGLEGVPTGLLLRANHGGEFVDLLRFPSAAVRITGDGPPMTAAGLVPVRVTERTSDRQLRVRTVWGLASDPAFSYTQTVTVFRDGTTLRIAHAAPGHRISTELVAPLGTAITSLEITRSEAVACFTVFGGSEPCVRIHAAQAVARMSETADGALRISSGSSGRLDLLITDLTAGDASVGLVLLRPAEVVDAHDIGAALLFEPDPAYGSRLRRLERLGFEETRAFGPYRVLLRADSASP